MPARVQRSTAFMINTRKLIALSLITFGLAAFSLSPGPVSAQSVAGEPLRIENVGSRECRVVMF